MDKETIVCKCASTIGTGIKCMTTTSSCCWCSDKRTVLQIYVDEYGMIEPVKHHSIMPRDLYYCSSCRHPDTISVGMYTETLKQILPKPSEFHEKITKEQKRIHIAENNILLGIKLAKETDMLSDRKIKQRQCLRQFEKEQRKERQRKNKHISM